MIVNLFDYLTFDLDFYVHFSSSLSCCIYLDCALHVLFSCAILIAFSLLTLIVLPSASLFYLFCTCNCNAFLSLARFFGHLYLVLLFMVWHFIPVHFYWRPFLLSSRHFPLFSTSGLDHWTTVHLIWYLV